VFKYLFGIDNNKSKFDSWGNQELATCSHAGFWLSLFFDPEDGGDTFLRNVGWLSTDYMALYPRR
jgi:hypothetical protein